MFSKTNHSLNNLTLKLTLTKTINPTVFFFFIPNSNHLQSVISPVKTHNFAITRASEVVFNRSKRRLLCWCSGSVCACICVLVWSVCPPLGPCPLSHVTHLCVGDQVWPGGVPGRRCRTSRAATPSTRDPRGKLTLQDTEAQNARGGGCCFPAATYEEFSPDDGRMS